MSITISTLGDLLDHGYGLHFYCDNSNGDWRCGFNKAGDIEALAKTLGRKQSFINGAVDRQLRCPKCGTKRMTSRLSKNMPEPRPSSEW